MRTRAILACLLAAALTGGCSDWLGLGPPEDYEKPTVAVMRFDNRAPAGAAINVGEGTCEVLVDRLLATGRYQVVERAELGGVFGELRLQQSGHTREESRAEPGRLKNAQYLIKGTVTDFGYVAADRGFFGMGSLSLAGGSQRAVMSINLQVVDVESGEVICSRSIEETVWASEASARASLKGLTMGGSVFRATPLGEAAEKVIGRAVREITLAVAARPWSPRVAQVEGGAILISGGQDRRMFPGSEYEVIAPGRPVHDPATGDVIGRGAGTIVARLRVTRVWPGYSETALVSGDAKDLRVGLLCRRAETIAAR